MSTFEFHQVGSVEGTGAEIKVPCGFRPGYVKCMNIDDAGGDLIVVEAFDGMADGDGLKRSNGDAHVKLGAAGGGITFFDGDSTHPAGFKIGTDGDLNVAAETIKFICFR